MEGSKGPATPRHGQTLPRPSGPLNRVKHYGIISPIGKGGMGEVYLAHDAKLDRRVAIKFLPDTLHRDLKARERFLREAKAAAALDHPFICKIIEAGEFQAKSFIVMEYVEGQNLKDKIGAGPLPLADALRVSLEVAEALEAAHAKGIVHRDLKPANLMCTSQGHIKVMDFGLAKHILPEPEPGAKARTLSETLTAVADERSITQPGVVVGTIAYMAPEQARGEAVDARTDIFALGIVLAEMISGRHPFDRATPLETLTAVLRDDPPPVHVIPKVLNPGLGRILHKALAKDPAMRYQKIGEMAADIRALQMEVAPRRWMGFRNPWAMAGTLALGAVILASAGLLFLKRKPALPPAAPKIVKVLIADFENKTGDPVFDGALEQTFGISLEGASFINVADRARARQLAGTSRLDREKALLVSRREGIDIVVNGSIESGSGNKGYTIRMEALDSVSTDKVTEASQTIKTKAEVLKAADSLATKLRADLGAIPKESSLVLTQETFTSASLEAMNAYARGQDLAAMGKDDEAIKEYLKAIELDPKLGRAYAGLAVVYRNRLELEEAKKYYDKAMTLLDQMTDREKYRTRGGYYFVNRNYKKAIEEFGTLLKLFPMDPAAYTNLPLAYFYARDMQKAFDEGRKAIELFPNAVTPRYNLAWYAITAGKFEVAEAEAPNIMKLDPSFAEAHVCLALVRMIQGRNVEAADEYHKLETMGPYAASLAAAGQADLALYEGRLDDARKILEAAITADLKNGLKAFAAQNRIVLAQTLFALGKKEASIKTVEGVLAESKNEGVLFLSAQLYLDAGLVDKGRGLARSLDTLLEPEPQAYNELVEGEISLRAGNLPECVKRIHEAQNQVDTWIGHLALGKAYLKAGQFTEAYSEFELCLNRRGEAASVFLDDLPTLRYLPQIYYYLGRAQEGLKIPAAKESYKKFLEIKILAAGDPLVDDAKRRLSQI